jgi:uncharacterized protein (DUF2147 family)
MKKLVLLALCSVALAASAERGFSSPVGLWLAKDGGKLRIAPCGRGMCGFIAETVDDPATGKPPTDKHNPNPAKRNRPLVGVQTLVSMQPSGPSKWTGRLYNDDDGQFYTGHLIELSPTTIRIEGCSGALCGGDQLTRVK